MRTDIPTPISDACEYPEPITFIPVVGVHVARNLEIKLAMCREFINEICDSEGRFPYLNGTGVVSAAYTTLENTKP